MGSQQNTRFGRRTAVLRDAFARDDELRGYLERIAGLTYLPVTRTGEATQMAPSAGSVNRSRQLCLQLTKTCSVIQPKENVFRLFSAGPLC